MPQSLSRQARRAAIGLLAALILMGALVLMMRAPGSPNGATLEARIATVPVITPSTSESARESPSANRTPGNSVGATPSAITAGHSERQIARILFLEPHGNAVDGVTLWTRAEGNSTDEYALRGTSTASGTLSIELDSSPVTLVLRYKHNDFAGQDVRVRLAGGEEHRIQLEPGSSICGVVRNSNGEVVTEGPWVLAYQICGPPSTRQVVNALAGAEEPISVVRVGPDGAFCIAGLAGSAEYLLLLGGAGYASGRASGPFRPGDSEVRLQAFSAYGCVVRMIDGQDGQPIRGALNWIPTDPHWYWGKERKYLSIALDSLQGALLGIRPEAIGAGEDFAHAALLLLDNHAQQDLPFLGPVLLTGQAMGWQRIESSIAVPRLKSALSFCDITLTSIGGPTTDVSVSWALPSGFAPSRPRTRQGPAARVLLIHLENRSGYELQIGDLTAGHLTWPKVPNGTYYPFLTLATEGNSWRPDQGAVPVEIGPTSKELHFSLGDSHCVECEVVRRDGTRWEGAAIFEVDHASADGDTSTFVVFESAPYRIDGLRSETYKIAISQPFAADKTTLELASHAEMGWLQHILLREQ